MSDDDPFVEVHENIGKEGCIVELRPPEHDTPADRDMSHLSEEKARELYEELGSYLGEDEKDDVEGMTWEQAQAKVREFAQGEVRALTPMTGEMVVLYDEGKYGPDGRDSPPNVELITKADSIWDCWTDDGSTSFRSILRKYGLEVLKEEDLSHKRSDANSKAYVGTPKDRIVGE